MVGGIPLKLLVEELRREVMEAAEAGAGKDLAFEVQELDLELQVVAQQSGEGNVGVKFWVLEAGVKEAETHGTTQIVRFKLKPQRSDGGKTLVSDRRAASSGG